MLEQYFNVCVNLAYLEVKEMTNLFTVRKSFQKLLSYPKLDIVNVSSNNEALFVKWYLKHPVSISLCFSNFSSVKDWQLAVCTALQSRVIFSKIIINRAWISDYVCLPNGRGNLSQFVFWDRMFACKNVSFVDCAIDDGFTHLPGSAVNTSSYSWFRRAAIKDTDLMFKDAKPISIPYSGTTPCHSPQFNPFPPLLISSGKRRRDEE